MKRCWLLATPSLGRDAKQSPTLAQQESANNRHKFTGVSSQQTHFILHPRIRKESYKNPPTPSAGQRENVHPPINFQESKNLPEHPEHPEHPENPDDGRVRREGKTNKKSDTK